MERGPFPPSLQSWLDVGGEFRSLPDDLLAGKCGALIERQQSEASAAVSLEEKAFCARDAGWGTDHPRIGRCRFHGENYADGLPPWIGELTEETWSWITRGAERVMRESGAFKVERVRKSFEDFVRDALDAGDREVYEAVRADPVLVIDQEIKLNRVQAVQLLRFKKHRQQILDMQQQTVGGPLRDSAIERADMALQRQALILARLLEVRARYSELEDSRRSADEITKMLQVMSNEEFARLRSDPSNWHRIASGAETPRLPEGYDA